MRGSVLITDSSPLFREGLRRLLRQGRFVVSAEGRDVTEAKANLRETDELALVVCTITPESAPDDMDRLVELRQRFQALKIIAIMTSATAPAVWRRVLEMSDAMLSRDISSMVLQRAIELVMAGGKFLSTPVLHVVSLAWEDMVMVEAPASPAGRQPADYGHEAKPILAADPMVMAPPAGGASDHLNLSERERQILQCLVRGDPNKVIARELRIAEATVKVHVKGLLRKLRAANRTQAAVWALNNGLASNGLAPNGLTVMAAE